MRKFPIREKHSGSCDRRDVEIDYMTEKICLGVNNRKHVKINRKIYLSINGGGELMKS
jgi:hypothetical protein